MRIATLAIVLALTGCSALEYRPLCPGTRSYDPQICRGEKWQQLPNWDHEAVILRERGVQW